jgi:hypothetical protein
VNPGLTTERGRQQYWHRFAAGKRHRSKVRHAPAIPAGQEMTMLSSFKWVLAFGVGLVGGWAARSLSDSPEGAGVKLLEIGIKAKDQVDRWAAIERERLDDMMAEARSNISRENEAANKPGHKGSSESKRATRLVKVEERA